MATKPEGGLISSINCIGISLSCMKLELASVSRVALNCVVLFEAHQSYCTTCVKFGHDLELGRFIGVSVKVMMNALLASVT